MDMLNLSETMEQMYDVADVKRGYIYWFYNFKNRIWGFCRSVL